MLTDNKEVDILTETIKETVSLNESSFNWIALITICLGALMVVIDETIVNVALPSIKISLGFSDTNLAWIVNAYLISFGGFLLLTGRIGDLYGNKKLFLFGIAGFTFFSLTSGLATSQSILLLSRIGQGITGAVISAISLSLIVSTYRDAKSMAKAMGLFSAALAGGGSIGVFLGGLITSYFGWHWIFFINLPTGIVVFFLVSKLVQESKNKSQDNRKLDVWGALTVTLSSLLVVYGIVNGNEIGWFTFQTFVTIFIGILLFIIFVFIEYRSKYPLIPLGLLKIKNLVVANAIAILWAAAMFALFFLSTLYLQQVLELSPIEVGLTFLPTNLSMALLSILVSEKLVNKYGVLKTVSSGIFLNFVGMLLLARTPINGQVLIDVMPAMLLFGIGSGIAFNPLLLAAMNGIDEEDSGLASSLVNMSFVMGGALGLAILSSTADLITKNSLASGFSLKFALNSGYNFAFFIASILILISVILCLLYLNIDLNEKNVSETNN